MFIIHIITLRSVEIIQTSLKCLIKEIVEMADISFVTDTIQYR